MYGNPKLLKNPVAKNKLNFDIDNPVGEVLEEIQEQDVSGQNGGVTPWIISTISAVSAAATVVSNVVSASATNPGRYCTVSAECSTSGKACA